MKLIILPLVFCCLHMGIKAQPCTTLGQNPETAFPVCGTSAFFQSNVPICSSNNLFVPGCSGTGTADYENKNPFWYKFTCYQSGTLSFTITPVGQQEDYDWQLYDITGLSPTEVYTNTNIIVAGNWSGSYGPTGASATGAPPPIQCASLPADNKPTFARSPNIVQGREYILLVSHYTDNQSGYSLTFGGGTAVITDPTEPHLSEAKAPCDGLTVTVKLNKKIKCNSIASNGSDFTINTALTSIIGAVGIGCNSGFDTDSLRLTLSNPLPPGNYIITIQNGNDGNTLRDNCDRDIPPGENLQVQVFPIFPTPMDSLTRPGCSPDKLEIVFRKPIQCNSIAANGSDFTITGPYPVTVTGASGDCNGGLTNKITIQLSAPMQVGGNFQLTLVPGSDGTTVIDECGQPTLAGSTINFSVADTVNADFSYQKLYGCITDTVNYFHDGRNGVNSWMWTFDGIQTSQLQNPTVYYNVFNEKTASLVVSNGTCTDSSSATVLLTNTLKAGFSGPSFICPGDVAVFKDTSIGSTRNWQWDFGNGNSSSVPNPPAQSYMNAASTFNITVSLAVTNDIGCIDTVKKIIPVINNCYIAVPGAFTPNGDGLNDYLYPLNAYKALDLEFSVYNRFGQRMFYTRDWLNKWDGSFKGQGADPGTYVWMLKYIHLDTGQKIEQKGTVILIRQ